MSSPFLSQQHFLNNNHQHRGRFAPSPSGPLHFGSLVAALGSYLQAKANDGLWFVRIEDIDKPRERPGARDLILDGLLAYGMQWDTDDNTPERYNYRDCLVQSERLERYQQVLDYLIEQQMVYGCDCTRKQIKLAGGLYNSTCKNKHLDMTDSAIRIHIPTPCVHFKDLSFNDVTSATDFASEDFIIKRRDGLFAYQLVVVIDDIDQGINQVVRGADIMELTTRQISLYQLFNVTPPSYLHLPLAVSKPGFKLSKQNHAQAIDLKDPKPELMKAINFLGLNTQSEPDLASGNIQQILAWAVNNWSLQKLPTETEILV